MDKTSPMGIISSYFFISTFPVAIFPVAIYTDALKQKGYILKENYKIYEIYI
jgi:hypothetical protein